MNAEGTVDLESDQVDISGTIVPAYTFNTLIDVIPVLGELLTGGEGEGLFGGDLSGRRDDRRAGYLGEPALRPGAGLPPRAVLVRRREIAGGSRETRVPER